MATLTPEEMRVNKALIEYLIGIYYQQTGNPLNGADFYRADLEDHPIMDQANKRTALSYSLARLYLRDENLRESVLEIRLTEDEGDDALRIMEKAKTARGKVEIEEEFVSTISTYLETNNQDFANVSFQEKVLEISYETEQSWPPHFPDPRYKVYVTTIANGVIGIRHEILIDEKDHKEIVRLHKKMVVNTLQRKARITRGPSSGSPVHVVSSPNRQAFIDKYTVTGVPAMKLTRCEIGVAKIGLPLVPKASLSDRVVADYKNDDTYALKCSCEKSFFCSSVSHAISSDRDAGYWAKKISHAKAPGRDKFFWLAIPFFDRVLYSFRVKSMIQESWSGDLEEKLLVSGITENETFFFDTPGYGIMASMNSYINFHLDSVDSRWAGPITDFVAGRSRLDCSARTHNYGTNQRLIGALKGSESGDEFKALILCMDLYDLCTPCYQNAMPVFSLLPDLTS